MTNQHSFLSADHDDRDLFATSQTGERILNAAIVQAEISESFEEYLEIFDAFYADDVEVSTETEKEPIRGRARVRSLLYNFLVPLHIMAEVGGLSTSIRETPDSRRRSKRDAFCVDARSDRSVRCYLHSKLVHPAEMERVAHSVRAPL